MANKRRVNVTGQGEAQIVHCQVSMPSIRFWFSIQNEFFSSVFSFFCTNFLQDGKVSNAILVRVGLGPSSDLPTFCFENE